MMKQVSEMFKAAINKTSRTVHFKATFTYIDSSGNSITEELTQEDFQGEIKVTSSSLANDDDFSVGGCVIKEFTATLINKNNKYKGCKLVNGKIIPYSGITLENGEIEYVKLGIFYIDTASKPYQTIKISALDDMSKFDKSYKYSNVNKDTYVYNLLIDACHVCGVDYNLGYFSGDETPIKNIENKSDYTFRDIISGCAAVAGGFAYINSDGQLEIIEFVKTDPVAVISPDKTRMSIETYEKRKIDGLLYKGTKNYVFSGSGEEVVYPMIIEANPVMDNIPEDGMYFNDLLVRVENFEYVSYDCDFLSNPAIEPGDWISFPDTRDGDITGFIGTSVFIHGGTQNISCPDVTEFDKSYLVSQGTTTEEVQEVNDNLLYASQFTSAFYDDGIVIIDDIQCMGSIVFPFKITGDMPIWRGYILPAEKNTNAQKTLSFYGRAKNQACTLKLLGVTNLQTFSASDIGNAALVRDYGTIVVGLDWDWYTLTFNQSSSHIDTETLILFCEMNFYYLTSQLNNYITYISKAKLEEGPYQTEYLLNKYETLSQDAKYNVDGLVSDILSSIVITPLNTFGDRKVIYGNKLRRYSKNLGAVEMLTEKDQYNGMNDRNVIKLSKNGNKALMYYNDNDDSFNIEAGKFKFNGKEVGSIINDPSGKNLFIGETSYNEVLTGTAQYADSYCLVSQTKDAYVLDVAGGYTIMENGVNIIDLNDTITLQLNKTYTLSFDVASNAPAIWLLDRNKYDDNYLYINSYSKEIGSATPTITWSRKSITFATDSILPDLYLCCNTDKGDIYVKNIQLELNEIATDYVPSTYFSNPNPHVHEYTSEIVTPATHTTDGVIKYTCIAGDDFYTEVIPATGHTYGEWVVITEPTTTTTGLKRRTCSVDGAYQEEVIPMLEENITYKNLFVGETSYDTTEIGSSVLNGYAKGSEFRTVTNGLVNEQCHYLELNPTLELVDGNTYCISYYYYYKTNENTVYPLFPQIFIKNGNEVRNYSDPGMYFVFHSNYHFGLNTINQEKTNFSRVYFSFTYNSDTPTTQGLYITVPTSANIDKFYIKNIQIEEGTTATDYEKSYN